MSDAERHAAEILSRITEKKRIDGEDNRLGKTFRRIGGVRKMSVGSVKIHEELIVRYDSHAIRRFSVHGT